MLRKLAITFLFAALFFPVVYSQAPVSWTSADIYLALRKLNVLGSVLYIAAHPDDENTRLLTYFSKDRMLRTGYLSLTRGDGGQNLIGDEQGVELGLIRTQELLAARRIDGAEQFFTRAFDFGFSKNPEETFTKWDKEKILSDVVWVIRKFQPDVIITRFPTTGEGGHGHHTASAILANEAFIAAADPKRFPEQLKFVTTWQAKRILWNTFNFGSTNTTSAEQFKFDVGAYNPLLGKSYGEIAAASRSQHKSQGFGVPAGRGEAIEFFKTTNGPAPVNDIMDDVQLTWNRVKGGEKISRLINDIAAGFDWLHPEKSVKGLVELYNAIQGLPDGYWKNHKLKETQQLIEQCSGLFIDVTSPEQFGVQTDSVKFNFLLNNRLGVSAMLKNVSTDGFDSSFNQPLLKNKNFGFAKTFYVPVEKQITQPYWLASKMEEGYFNVSDQQKIGQPDVDPAYTVSFLINIEGQDFYLRKPVKYKFTDPVKGELYEPLVVVPPVLLSPDENLKISKDNNEFTGEIDITAKKSGWVTTISDVGRENPDNPIVQIAPNQLVFEDKNKTIPVSYSIKAGRDNQYYFAVNAGNGGKDVFFAGMKEIRYDHIPFINYFFPATVVNKKIDLKIYGKKIGYIVGAGDKVPEALEQMGYEVTLLGDKELLRNNLKQFDAIITGVRSHNTNDWLNKHYDKLMNYVKEGGNYIVQYNTSNSIGPVRAKIGPFNFDISRTRVTDEKAPVKILSPEHSVLHFPNEITEKDFEGWIQERSIYHAANFDRKNFETVFAMNDPGENADDGSLIISRYGKGTFVYTGLVFFRELPAGVPGAYRLLANIIALNRQKPF
ncbi:MAG: PIG-L family deacetylase [Chitinophagaceae bacterium]